MDTTTAEIPATLNKDEILRYSRHLIMPEVGMDGQQKLKAARVLCIGTGGLGSPMALYLAAAGIGTLGLIDFDVVDFSNLQRQIIHSTADVGRKKLDSTAAELLRGSIPSVESAGCSTPCSTARMRWNYFVSSTSSPTVPTTFLRDIWRDDACVLTGKPNVYGSIFRFEGRPAYCRNQGRSVLSLPLPGAATAGSCAFLRRGRGAWHSSGTRWRNAGYGGHQADSRHWRSADWASAADRRAGHEVPRIKAAKKSPGLPGLRHASRPSPS